MARGRPPVSSDYREEPEGLEGVTGGWAVPVGAGWGPLGGAGSFQEWRRDVAVERSTVLIGGALGEEGTCWPLSPTSMASSVSEGASDTSL